MVDCQRDGKSMGAKGAQDSGRHEKAPFRGFSACRWGPRSFAVVRPYIPSSWAALCSLREGRGRKARQRSRSPSCAPELLPCCPPSEIGALAEPCERGKEHGTGRPQGESSRLDGCEEESGCADALWGCRTSAQPRGLITWPRPCRRPCVRCTCPAAGSVGRPGRSRPCGCRTGRRWPACLPRRACRPAGTWPRPDRRT